MADIDAMFHQAWNKKTTSWMFTYLAREIHLHLSQNELPNRLRQHRIIWWLWVLHGGSSIIAPDNQQSHQTIKRLYGNLIDRRFRGFKLSKWISNDSAVLSALSSDRLSPKLINVDIDYSIRKNTRFSVGHSLRYSADQNFNQTSKTQNVGSLA